MEPFFTLFILKAGSGAILRFCTGRLAGKASSGAVNKAGSGAECDAFDGQDCRFATKFHGAKYLINVSKWIASVTSLVQCVTTHNCLRCAL